MSCFVKMDRSDAVFFVVQYNNKYNKSSNFIYIQAY
jgi:hypothetical protein